MSSATALAHAPFALLPFEHKLDRLAEVAVRIGAGLQPDQELVITAPIEAVPLVRRITEQAYKAGAKLVTTFYADDATSLSRYQHAPDGSFDYAPTWYYDALAAAYKSNAARMGITGEDPIADWKQHNANLTLRVDYLNHKRYHSIRFFTPDNATDLTVGLADQHLWAGGGSTASNGFYCNANIPTEECFTTPHKARVNGHVTASKPLSHQGTLIENIRCTFKDGKIVEATATAGEAALNKLISTDEGARRLGEVALVPHNSPIAQSEILFWSTLFDENAASHIALGQAYSTCLIGGEKMSSEELAALGANESLIHVDWMIGGPTMNVDGISADGSAEPLMREGDWV